MNIIQKIQDAAIFMDSQFLVPKEVYLTESDFDEFKIEMDFMCRLYCVNPNQDFNYIQSVKTFIYEDCRPIGEKVKMEVATKNGCHLITSPFDPREFSTKFPEIEIHKNNPTILYIP